MKIPSPVKSPLNGARCRGHTHLAVTVFINANLIGINKVVSNDSVRCTLKRPEEEDGIHWLLKHGKGFAVVADEIRKLAERSKPPHGISVNWQRAVSISPTRPAQSWKKLSRPSKRPPAWLV